MSDTKHARTRQTGKRTYQKHGVHPVMKAVRAQGLSGMGDRQAVGRTLDFLLSS